MTNHKWAFASVIVGVIALIIAIFQRDLAAAFPSKHEKEKTVLDKLGDLFLGKKNKAAQPNEQKYSSAQAFFFGQPADEGNKSESLYTINLIYRIIGTIGVISAIVSFVKKEDLRLSFIASSISLCAILWNFVIIVFVFALIGLFLMAVFSNGF